MTQTITKSDSGIITEVDGIKVGQFVSFDMPHTTGHHREGVVTMFSKSHGSQSYQMHIGAGVYPIYYAN